MIQHEGEPAPRASVQDKKGHKRKFTAEEVKVVKTKRRVFTVSPYGYLICGAKVKARPGFVCGRDPLKAKTRCRYHGGLAGRKPRKYSSIFAGFDSQYDVFLEQTKLTSESLKDGLAALDVCIDVTARMAERGDSVRFREDSSKLFDRYERLLREGKEEEADKTLDELGKKLRTGYGQAQALKEVADLVDKRQKRHEAAVQSKQKDSTMYTYSHLVLFAGQLLEVVKQETALDVTARVASKFEELLLGNTPRESGSPEVYPSGTGIRDVLEVPGEAPPVHERRPWPPTVGSGEVHRRAAVGEEEGDGTERSKEREDLHDRGHRTDVPVHGTVHHRDDQSESGSPEERDVEPDQSGSQGIEDQATGQA